MLTDPMTLYKLMILYMLRQVKFPLTQAQFCDFFLEKDYTTYFNVQTALTELQDAGLVQAEAAYHSTRYQITRDGEETLSFFSGSISPAAVADMDQFLADNRIRLRDEVGTHADYYRGTGQDYVVRCEIREGKNVLIGLNVSAPTAEMAQLMCDRWKDASQKIYETVMQELLRDEEL